jgi:hypothetical protein
MAGGDAERAERTAEALSETSMGDDLRDLLRTLTPSAREPLRVALIHDQADRDVISSKLLRYRDERGDDWADIIDMLTLHPDARRKVVRLLGEIEARGRGPGGA